MSLDNRRAVPRSPRARRTIIHGCEAATQRTSAKVAGRRGFIHFSTPRDRRQDSPARVPSASGSLSSYAAVEDRSSPGARILRWMADIEARYRLASDHVRPPHASRHVGAVPRNNLACGIRMRHDALRRPKAGCGGRAKYRRTSRAVRFSGYKPSEIFFVNRDEDQSPAS